VVNISPRSLLEKRLVPIISMTSAEGYTYAFVKDLVRFVLVKNLAFCYEESTKRWPYACARGKE
jgi:hypothetical protein